jgi:hypothetical protein
MATADTLAKQMKESEQHEKETRQLIVKEKELLRTELADIDRHVAAMHGRRSKVASDLSKLS